jgi:hypothetical protein
MDHLYQICEKFAAEHFGSTVDANMSRPLRLAEPPGFESLNLPLRPHASRRLTSSCNSGKSVASLGYRA